MSVVERERTEIKWKVTDADVLTRAADLLEEFGWCQGRAGSKQEGQFCLMGAVTAATTDLLGHHSEECVRRVRNCFMSDDGLRLGDSPYPAAAWNDTEGRTKDEVVTALREAAAKARA